jgi:7-cyano-7-deazaguanine synthase
MRVVVLLSGGLDSTVLLWQLHRDGHDCLPLGVRYGQRHGSKELDAAARVCRRLGGLPLRIVNAMGLIKGHSALLGDGSTVPQGRSPTDPAQSATVVPGRNLLLLALAVGHALGHGAEAVAIGVNADDQVIYPDCRKRFLEAARATLASCHEPGLQLLTPLDHQRKQDIVSLGVSLGVPFGLTWSCYFGGDTPCTVCAACMSRGAAFDALGLEDQ